MKKQICALLSLLLFLPLFGCAEKQQSTDTPNKPPFSSLIPSVQPSEIPETTAPSDTETLPMPTQPQYVPEELLSPENQRDINIFLSNFAEQGFAEYPTDDYSLLHFGYIFAKINRSSVLHLSGDHYYISQKDMDTILFDFFDKTVTPPDSYYSYYHQAHRDPITFDGEKYLYPASDGAMYNYLAVVSSMTANADGTCNVTFDIYRTEDDVRSSDYDLTAIEAASSTRMYWHQSGHAVVQEHTRASGKESYALLSYVLE